MRKDLYLAGKGMDSLNPLWVGWEECLPGHFSEGIRQYTMIHYVREGSGVLLLNGVEYSVNAGQIFIIPAGEKHFYRASKEKPWSYIWLCFDGARAEEFRRLSPVLPYPRDTFRRLPLCEKYGGAACEYVTSCLFELYAALFGESKREEEPGYAERAKSYVDSLYMLRMGVEQIARQLSVDRRYLGRLFREKYGMTLQQYLIRVRLEHAAALIAEGTPAGEAGHLSGYDDTVNFYRMFKRYMGVGPAAYRKLSKKG